MYMVVQFKPCYGGIKTYSLKKTGFLNTSPYKTRTFCKHSTLYYYDPSIQKFEADLTTQHL